ncbi:MAG: calcium-translocating P-type ATPase, PMCA-type [Bradymonadales bacterium]|nr:calcium-translocating P-type ATPase, PMCA-type [Bradymonadales bacterium]
MDAEDTKQQSVDRVGLTAEQVLESRRLHGANLLTPPPRVPLWRQYLEKFDDPVIRILTIAAVLAILVGIGNGHYVEGIGIIVAILLATGLSFLNEYRANRAFEILNKSSDETPVKVLRDGSYQQVARRDIVVGDLVVLELGEEVPADAEVLESVSFQIDQSSLTGESLPVSKVPVGTALESQDDALPRDHVYRQTLVSDGNALVRVNAVGDSTMAGHTAREAAAPEVEETPLNQQLTRLSKLIGVIGFAVAGATFFSLTIHGALTGKLALSGEQWLVLATLVGCVLVMAIRVWLPILFDGISFFTPRIKSPAWLESGGGRSWLVVVGGGLGLLVLLLAVYQVTGLADLDPSLWFGSSTVQRAVEKLLAYFMIAVTLIVVAVPEGLAMSVTLSLAYSMRKMTAQNNLVRKMRACETIGAATVICSDKTGTLTLNQMHIRNTFFPLVPEEHLLSRPDTLSQQERLIVEAMAANSTAHLGRQANGELRVLGNPTEGALLRWLDAHSEDYEKHRLAFHISQQWTFRTERKFMATLGHPPDGQTARLHVKGAPEILLDRCRVVATPTDFQPISTIRDEVEQSLKEYQQRGMRTLAFAYQDEVQAPEGSEIEELATDLVWLGFVAMEDAVRPEVPPAIRACAEAGVKVKIVTGDTPLTAMEIARQIGLWKDQDGADRIITGKEFAELSDPEVQEAVGRLKIISRARPMDKLRLVAALQRRGEVVAVTGDGTNDAPALNRAHVGLAMGSGTAVAKEASDIVLLDDSFGSIVTGILWGRSLYENIQRFILFQLTINVAALGTAFLGPFLGVDLPLTVIQMLWVNLIMDTLAALALATEPPNPAVLKRPPRARNAFIINPPMTRGILGTGFLFLLFFIGLLLWFKGEGATGGTGELGARQATLFFAIFVFAQFWNIFNARALGTLRPFYSNFFGNLWFVFIVAGILVGTVIMVQIGGEVFRTIPLSALDWILVIGGTSVVLWVGEALRFFGRRRSSSAC